jgi:chitinase
VRILLFAFAAALAAAPAHAGSLVIGYFAGWNGTRGYTVKNIETSGSAGKLTHINYAFGNVAGGKCAVSSALDDYERPFDAQASVDGSAGNSADARTARGNFGQLLKLKALHPNLKVLISLGGWTGSGGFSSAVETEASRRALVSSCIDLFVRGNLPNGMTAAGLFDGIDIDWEYPGTCGVQCGVPEDAQRFTELLAEFRRQLDVEGRQRSKHYELTIAAPAGTHNYIVLELRRIAPLLDFINLMTYDYHEAQEPMTNHLAPLDGSKADPSYSRYGWVDATVADFLAAEVPPSKLVLGLPFYGAGWKDVPGLNHGMYQRAGGPAKGHGAFRNLKTLQGFDLFRDPETQAAWLYNSATRVLWTYEDPATIATKMRYVKKRGLGGAMFWELSGDDDSGTLLNAIVTGLK